MAISAFQKLMNELLQQFIKVNGRHPQTPKEMMDLQNEAVQFFNKTKGVPPGPKEPPFQGFNPRVIEGGKGQAGPEVSGIDSLLKSDFEKTVRPNKDRPSIRLMKNFDQELDDITLAKEGYNLQEIGILKRARDVMKKEGQNPDDALAWVRSEMADAKGIEYEDFMTDFDWGDFPGNTEFAVGGLVKGGKWFLKSLKDSREQMKSMEMSPDQLKYYLGQIDDQIKNIEAGGQIPEEIIQTIRKDPKFKSLIQTRAQDPDLREIEEVLLEYGQRHASGGLAYMLGEPTYMKAGGGRIGLKKGSESWRNKITRWAGGTSALAGELGLEGIHQMQSLLGLGGLYASGGSVGHGPWTKGQAPQQPQQQQPQQAPMHPQQGQPNPMKMPQGIPSAAPRSMDPRVMQQQAMQKAMMGQQGQRPRMQDGGPTPEEFWNDKNYNQMRRLMDEYERYKKNYDKDKQRRSGIEEAAQGGRIGLMYGGDPGFQFEYGGSWADWHDQHRNAMPVEDYIQTKMPKERLPFRDSAQTGGRIGFKFGSIDKGRRAFMKWLAGITAGGIAAGSGILKFGKAATVAKVAPKATEAVVALEKAAGMPYWFPALVNKVIKQGDDVTAKLAVKERQTVHHANLDDVEDVTVYRDLDSGNVHVEYGPQTFDENGKVVRASNDTETVHLDYKAGEVIEEGKMKGKKTKSEFSASEPEPEVANWDGDIEMSGINEVNKVDDLTTPTSKLQEFATDKKLNIRERLKLERQQKYKNKLNTDTMTQIDYVEKKHGPFPDPGDYSLDADEMAEVIPKWQGKASGGLAHLLGE